MKLQEKDPAVPGVPAPPVPALPVLEPAVALNGAIILGIGGDNSNHSWGTFFEGVVTAGRPTDATDAAVLQNVQAAGYGR